jgi:hypothetical protein
MGNSVLDDEVFSSTGIVPANIVIEKADPDPQPPADLRNIEYYNRKIDALGQDQLGIKSDITGLDQANDRDRDAIMQEKQESNQRIRDLGPWPNLPLPEFKAEQFAMNNQARVAAGILAAVALIGSATMKTGAVGAMTALTATITGFHTGHQAMYERGRQEYKDNLAAIIAEHKDTLAERQEIISNEKMNAQEKVDAYNLSILKRGDARKDMVRSLSQINTEINSLFRAGIELTKIQEKEPPVPKDTRTAQEKQIATAVSMFIKEKGYKPTMDDPAFVEYRNKMFPPSSGGKAGRGFTPSGSGAAAAGGGPKTRKEAVDAFTAANPGKSKEDIEAAVTTKYPNLK